MLPALLLAAAAAATAAAAPVPAAQRLEDLARSIKSSYCPSAQVEGRVLARAHADDELKWILTEHDSGVRLALGSIDVDELLERMTEDEHDQVAFGAYAEGDAPAEGGSEGGLDASGDDAEGPRLDVSRLHPAFHDLAAPAEAALAALRAHAPPCGRWARWLGRCPVELAGHGLGGALAVLIAEHVPHARVTTFGMPPVVPAGRHEHWANGLDPVVRFLPAAGSGRRKMMKDAHEGARFAMARGRLADHTLVHSVSLEC